MHFFFKQNEHGNAKIHYKMHLAKPAVSSWRATDTQNFFIELRNNKSMHTDLVLHTKSRVAIKAPLHPALQTLGKVANGLGESGRNGSQDIRYQEPDYALVEDVVTGG